MHVLAWHPKSFQTSGTRLCQPLLTKKLCRLIAARRMKTKAPSCCISHWYVYLKAGTLNNSCSVHAVQCQFQQQTPYKPTRWQCPCLPYPLVVCLWLHTTEIVDEVHTTAINTHAAMVSDLCHARSGCPVALVTVQGRPLKAGMAAQS